MKDERHTLGRGQPVEHHEQRAAHRLGHGDLLVGGGGDGGRKQFVPAEHFGTPLLLAQPVEAFVGGHCGEPAGRIAHSAEAAPADLEPCGLDCIVGVVHRAEQSIRDCAQMAPIRFEPGRQDLFVVHVVTFHPRQASTR